MKYLICLIPLLLFAACGHHRAVEPDPPDTSPYQIQVGGSVTLDRSGTRFGFSAVVTDSRCPIGAICIWEGEAVARLWLLPTRSDTLHIELKIRGYVTQADTRSHIPVDTLGYRLTLMQLDPYPQVNVRINPKEYRAVVRVERK